MIPDSFDRGRSLRKDIVNIGKKGERENESWEGRILVPW